MLVYSTGKAQCVGSIRTILALVKRVPGPWKPESCDGVVYLVDVPTLVRSLGGHDVWAGMYASGQIGTREHLRYIRHELCSCCR